MILLLNRRGFSTHIQCPACGEVVRCPICDMALTHHRARRDRLVPLLRLSNARAARVPGVPVPSAFATEGSARSGSKRKSRPAFPMHACLRMDTDTMQKPGQPRAGA